MNRDEYIAAAMRTNAPSVGSHGQHTIDMAHAGLGLCDEAAELRQAIINRDHENIIEELGDLYWFAALADQSLHYPVMHDQHDAVIHDEYHALYDGASSMPWVESIMIDACEVAGRFKKCFAYGKTSIDLQGAQALHRLIYNVNSLAERYDSIDAIRRKNIAKLRARFPEKFSDEKALVRDVDNEYQQMRA